MLERTVSSRTVYRGRILDLEVAEVELEPGVRATREIVRRGDAVAVLAILPGEGMVLVRQYRKPVESEVLEIVAGGLEKGETPEACAVREMREETGYEVEEIWPLGTIWASPGYTTEQLYLFGARLKPGKCGCGADADERIAVVRVDESEFEAMVDRGEIRDGKTIVAWHLWKSSQRKAGGK